MKKEDYHYDDLPRSPGTEPPHPPESIDEPVKRYEKKQDPLIGSSFTPYYGWAKQLRGIR